MSKPKHIFGLWEAKIIDGRWCVGKAETMSTQADAAMVLNRHHSITDGVLAIALARTLAKMPLLPPPYDDPSL